MGTIYVARSPRLSQWGYDVGLSKSIYKIGLTQEPVKALVAAGWAGESDWVLVKTQEDVAGLSEDDIIDRLTKKEKMIDPNLYPRIKGAHGVFKVPPIHVENHLLVSRALASEGETLNIKIKHPDFAHYLIVNALP